MHPFPAEHDQQQALALDILKEAKSFILVHFPEEEAEGCDHPLCGLMHSHRIASVIASCSHNEFRHGMEAMKEEIMLISAIDMLMALNPHQRDQIAAILRKEEGADKFFHLNDDEG